MSQLSDALASLQQARERSDSIVVSYSGGKDSLVVMDMCVNNFSRVEAFLMEFVPNLQMNQERIDLAKSRWGVEVRRYPDIAAIEAIDRGMFCDVHWTRASSKKVTLSSIQDLVRVDFGIRLIATGHKASDSIGRKKQMIQAWNDDLITPLKTFRKSDVLSYMRAKKIPLPVDEGLNSNAIGLTTPFLLWCYDTYPEDFKRICAVFPYAGCVPWRRTFYGPAIDGRKRAASNRGPAAQEVAQEGGAASQAASDQISA